MAALDSMAQLTSLTERWDRESSAGQIPSQCLDQISQLIEKETEEWYKMDPDPFDDRHPGRVDPNCCLGHLLKALFKNDNLITKLVGSYLTASTYRDKTDLHISTCRLLLGIMPALESTVVFQENEGLVQKLMNWAQTADDPLKTYAVALLGGAMDIQDITANFKESNAVLVPAMIQKLHQLKDTKTPPVSQSVVIPSRPFKDIGKDLDSEPSTSEHKRRNEDQGDGKAEGMNDDANEEKEEKAPPLKKMRRDSHPLCKKIGVALGNKIHHNKTDDNVMGECSNSWSTMPFSVRGSCSKFPLTPEMQQRMIIQYLTPMGEYPELLSHMFEHNVLDLILHYIDHTKNSDVYLAFETTRFLAALLCHKKFAVEFISKQGVEKLLQIPRPSIAATGVSMCLYYLAYFEDAMERVCLLPHLTLNNLVSYMLWLLECSHESGRCHATMFFGISFPFKIILDLFDRHDGLRKVYNMASTLGLLNVEEDAHNTLSEDEIFTSLQAARHVMVALRKYFEAHLCIKANQLRRMHLNKDGVNIRSRSSTIGEIPAYKAAEFPPDVLEEDMVVLLDCMPMRMKWDPVENIVKLGGVQLCLQLLAMATEWSPYQGKYETIRNTLDILTILSVVPRVQVNLCDSVPVPDDNNTPAMGILLNLADGDAIPDPEVQKSAVRVIINCVCSPSSRYSNNHFVKILGSSAKRKNMMRKEEELLLKLWDTVRSNNGIMVLLKLMRIKTPITEADSIRVLACKALVGLARCDTVKQIISTLFLNNDTEFQQLLKEPVLQDKRAEHAKFCRYANELIELVAGKKPNPNIDASLDRIRRADVVAQTKIIYQEKELLTLIHDHLQSKGLHQAADALKAEADLPTASSPPHHPVNLNIYSTPTTPKMGRLNAIGIHTPRAISAIPVTKTPSTPSTSTAVPSTSTAPSTPSGLPIKLNLISSKINATASPTSSAFSRFQPSKKVIHKLDAPSHSSMASFNSPIVDKWLPKRKEHTMSLDKIVTEYLRKQHATCRNPVTTCPPFSLLVPHQCPIPRNRGTAPFNMAARLVHRDYFPAHGGYEGLKYTRKYIYSRFRPIRTYQDQEEVSVFSCCTFSYDEKNMFLGTQEGEMKVISLVTGEELGTTQCHTSPIRHCELSQDGKLLVTSSPWGNPNAGLWSVNSENALFEEKHLFDDDNYMEFGKNHNYDKLIGTQVGTANIYDVNTCELIMSLFNQDMANNYTRNQATFSYTDDIILNDGVLWDLQSAKPIHKFDKFNSHMSGVFHPMGMEVIINSEVWDLRTFRLLHTVPGLDRCQVRFNREADVIFGLKHQSDDDDALDQSVKGQFESAFCTFDATDYSQIATIDVKKNVFDLCTDASDCYLSVVESVRKDDDMQVEMTNREESCCHLYSIGRTRGTREQAEDDEEEDDDDDGGDDDDDDDDEDDEEDGDDDDVIELDLDEEDNEDVGDDDAEEAEEAVGAVADSSEIETDGNDEDDDDIDNMLFELSDLSNL